MISMLSMAYLNGGVLATLGVAISLVTGEWEWFSRSGSLIVAYGISVSLVDFDAWESWLRRSAEDSGTEVRGQDQFFQNIRKAITKRQLTIIFYGTLIWGFGDLFNEIIPGVLGLFMWVAGLFVGS